MPSYKPLPQFTDSDSEIDIFNAKAPINRNPQNKFQNSCKSQRTRRCLFSFIAITVILIVVVLFSLRAKEKTNLKLRSLLSKGIVNTKCGQIQGNIELTNIKNITKTTFAFYGIPYAKPPINQLRWKPPVPLSKADKECSSQVYKANRSNIKCYQEHNIGSEDCLYLNVWTPTLEKTANLPVFVYIHGGSLIEGYSTEYGYTPDAEFVTSMNVVAVSMNYRLNVFGFLALKELWEEGESYGNYGIMDQILVLKWIKNNIRNFGGNPGSVTVVGQSSGGTSIFGLLAAPLAEGLFHKAISASGSAKFEIDYKKAAEDNKVFIQNSKCKKLSNATEIRSCLYNLTSAEVYASVPWNSYPTWKQPDSIEFPSNSSSIFGALVVIDPIVIVKPPKLISQIKSWKSKTQVSILIGTMAQESGYAESYNFNNEAQPWIKFTQYLQKQLDTFSTNFKVSQILELYNYTENSDMNVQKMYETIVSDLTYNCPNDKLMYDISNSSKYNLYRYIVTHWLNKTVPSFNNLTASNAFHSLDVYALFGYKKQIQKGYTPNNSDLELMKNIRDVVKQFMVTGNLDLFKWKQLQTGVFNEKGDITLLTDEYHKNQCKFWNNPKNGFEPYAMVN